MILNFWLDKLPPTANVAFGDRWEGLTVQVTEPNGKTSTLGPFTTDDVGAAYTTYTPDTIGNYTFQMFFPGQTITGKNPNPLNAGRSIIPRRNKLKLKSSQYG